MKAVYIEKYGDIDIVQQGEQHEPSLQSDEVRVQVHAASVNPLDLRMLKGEFKAVLPVAFPFILGNDLKPLSTYRRLLIGIELKILIILTKI